MKKNIKIILLVLTVMSILFATSCKKADEDAVATVNGKAISEKDFTENYKVYELSLIHI